MTVAVEGQDDFGLNELALHYSVNGERGENRLAAEEKGLKTASGSTTISLEDFKLSPGDLVSLYATSRDAHSMARTDMFFVQAEPFERRLFAIAGVWRRRGGGDQDDNKISEREKEIIAATWNQIKDTSGDKAAASENAGFLSGIQSKLRDQAHSLSERMKARQLAGSSEEFKAFTADMDEAVKAMGPAADKLRGSQWQNALAPEQKALQHLLRAEAVMRDIKVAFGNRGGGGGEPIAAAERDLQSLFDLELDTEKNQYESGAIGRVQRSAAARNRRGAAEARRTGPPPAGTGRTAAPQSADVATTLAAGDAAPRSRRAAAQDGAAHAQPAGPAASGQQLGSSRQSQSGTQRASRIQPSRPNVFAAVAAGHRTVAPGPAGYAAIHLHAK